MIVSNFEFQLLENVSVKKKIAHVTFDMRIGGAEQVIFQLIRHTNHSKYESSVICLNSPLGPWGKQLQQEGYPIVCFDRKPGFDFSLVGRIRQYVIRNHIDVLHCHQYTPYIYGLFGGAFTGTEIIFTEHGRFYPDQRRLKRIVLNPLFSLFTNQITAISCATRDALVGFENFPKHKISIIYNGIENSLSRPSRGKGIRKSLKISETTPVLGTVGRLDSIKNQTMMIKALKIVNRTHPEVVLAIIGDGPERIELETLSSKLELTDKVIFTGYKEDPHPFYSIFDIFLLTSFSEGTAMTLLETMFHSLPCIVTNVGGNPEIVQNEKTGFVISSDDEEALAGRICVLLQNRDLKEAMGKAGRRRFLDNFTVEKMVTRYEAMYEAMIQ